MRNASWILTFRRCRWAFVFLRCSRQLGKVHSIEIEDLRSGEAVSPMFSGRECG
jgi:hypothetical protein